MKRLILTALLLAPCVFADDSLFLENTEKVELKEPLLRVTRPDKEWVFLDLEVLKKQELKKAGSAKGPVEDTFAKLKAELQLSSANASFFVYAWSDTHKEPPTAETLGGEVMEQTRGFFKDKGKVVGNGKAKLGKLDAWGIEVEGTLTSGGDELSVSKLVVYRPDDKFVFLLSLEVPKKKLEQVKKEKKKLFTSDVVKLQ
jgi:hypothetical protein